MHIFNMSVTYLQSVEKICESSRRSWFHKYVLSVLIQTSYRKHNSCNTDPSAPIFLLNMHCLMVMVWCKYEQNQTKAIKVIEKKP